MNDEASDGPVEPAPAGPVKKAREPTDGRATPRNRWSRISVELPDYLIEELKIRAIRTKASLRHIVMKSLRTQNFRILDADMVDDARKGNGKKQR
jgi:hypothetical protein